LRYVGLDFGEKTIGVAVSDPAGRIALGKETLRRDKPEALRANIRRLGEIIAEYGVTEIILGNPKSKSGGDTGERGAATQLFKEKLERNFKRVPVTLWDERFSTAAVARVFEGGLSHYGQRVDEMAAVYILQGYLDYKNKITEAAMDEEQKIITMCDEEGEETSFVVLSARRKDGTDYVLVEEYIPEDELDEDEFTDVLFFKNLSSEGDDMTFELVDDEHEEYEDMLELFEEDLENLEIVMEEDEDFDIEEFDESGLGE
jgi:putative Holliday junction resolvase